MRARWLPVAGRATARQPGMHQDGSFGASASLASLRVRASLKRRSKGPILGPSTDAGAGLAVSLSIIEKVKSVKGPAGGEFANDFGELSIRAVGDIPSDGVRSPRVARVIPRAHCVRSPVLVHRPRQLRRVCETPKPGAPGRWVIPRHRVVGVRNPDTQAAGADLGPGRVGDPPRNGLIRRPGRRQSGLG